MEAIIVMFQSLCVAGLALGTALSMYQLRQRDKYSRRFSYAVANGFETRYRRLARIRRYEPISSVAPFTASASPCYAGFFQQLPPLYSTAFSLNGSQRSILRSLYLRLSN